MALKINPNKTALVVIDLQKGIVANDTKPHSPDKVLGNATKIIDACRASDIQVFLVRVNPSEHTALRPMTDEAESENEKPLDWAELVPELGLGPKDIVITKHQWGAFFGTPLDLNLRRMGIDTIILCGIATTLGVESTARCAYEFGYNQIFAEDAMASFSQEEHDSTIKNVFRRIGRVRSTKEILDSLLNASKK